jgi:hypothetical protein
MTDIGGGWQELIAQESGRTYYYNASLSLTQWEYPNYFPSQIAPRPQSEEGTESNRKLRRSWSKGTMDAFDQLVEKNQDLLALEEAERLLTTISHGGASDKVRVHIEVFQTTDTLH